MLAIQALSWGNVERVPGVQPPAASSGTKPIQAVMAFALTARAVIAPLVAQTNRTPPSR